MSPTVGTLRVGRYFMALLLIFIALYAVVGFGSRQTPKLGIDLVGGKRVIFQARTTNGAAPSSNSMDEARQIIENRVNGQGVTGATVQVQNGNQLVVTIPGGTNTDVAQLGEPAILNFRGLMAPAVPVSCGTATAATPSTTSSATAASSSSASTTASPTSTKTKTTSGSQAGKATSSSTAAGNAASYRQLAAATSTSASPKSTSSETSTSGSSTPTSAASGTSDAAATSGASTSTKCESDPIGELFKTDPGLKKVMPNAESCPSPTLANSDCRAFSALSTTRQTELLSAISRYNCAAAQSEADVPDSYYIACDDGTQYGTPIAYLLGHVVVKGSQISSATAQAPGTNGTTTTSSWSINLDLTDSGGTDWGAWTQKYHTDSTTASSATFIQTSTTAPCGTSASATVPCSDFVGFTLNGQVISSPITTAVLTTQTQITGSYTQTSADKLTQELNYGKLPLSFKPLSNESVSATLGSVQLNGAFLAGGIGLALVVLYSLAYYRGLGLVTIASLLVSAGLTYAMLVILGIQIGFTLDLAGIAGFIVALGITADSFVVFFERIKDEVHEGRSMRVAVPRAWIRARRTILSADTVSFFAAAILYYFAAADVKGFAFTLGLSTILDLVVVFLFTHPIVSLLSRSRAFGSPRFTGLNSVRTGVTVSDDDSDLPRRRSAASVAGSARERAAGRRGISTPVADPPDTDADSSSTRTDSDTDEGDEPDGIVTSDDRPSDQAPTGGSAAERAAARRARRRQAGDADNEGTS